MKTLAVLLLMAAAFGWALGLFMGGQGAWGWLRAFCEAAAIGAIADWFAVVALFRRPMGLPIPHTAVIPHNKARIADSLADFVRDHFLDPDTLMAKLAALDPAGWLSRWMQDITRSGVWLQQARGWAVGLLESLDDQRVQRAIVELVMEKARQWDAASSVGEVLTLLTREGRHHAVLDTGLHKVGDYLAREEVKAVVAGLLLKHVRQEWPLVSGMVDKISSTSDMAARFADTLSSSVLAELRSVLAEPAHPLRQRYEQWLVDVIDRLRGDPALAQDFNRLKNQKLDDPVVQAYVASLGADIKTALQNDLGRPDSAVMQYAERAVRTLGEQMAVGGLLRDAVNQQVLAAANDVALTLRSRLTRHMSDTIKAWDDEQLVQQLERNVGKDLQYIRLNGTLVGGLVGLAIHAVVIWTA